MGIVLIRIDQNLNVEIILTRYLGFNIEAIAHVKKDHVLISFDRADYLFIYNYKTNAVIKSINNNL